MAKTSEKTSPFGRIETTEDIGQAVRHKRKEQGILQEKAAGLSGVGTKFLSQLENGKETAEIGKILQVLRAIGLEVYIYPRSHSPFKDR
jgi:HTH-type transcriptional regulator / antitoxin HipB